MSETHAVAVAELRRTPDYCERGCPSADACTGCCGRLPPRLDALSRDDLYELYDFANKVQRYAFRCKGETTFGKAAARFSVPVEKIRDAVVAHYWMFTLDDDLPLADRRIEHEGE